MDRNFILKLVVISTLIFSASISIASAKTNAPEQKVYLKTFDKLIDSTAADILTTKDNSLVVTGTMGRQGIFMSKVNKLGKTIWQIEMNSNYPIQVVDDVWQTKDGGYLLTGRFSGGKETSNVFLQKVSREGAKEWESYFPSNSDDVLYTVKPLDNGHFIAVGSKDTMLNTSRIFELEIDAKGKKVNERTFKVGRLKDVKDVVPTKDGGYFILGSIALHEIHMAKIDRSGKVVWEKSYPSKVSQVAYSAVGTTDGAFLVTGYRDVLGQGSDVLLMKVNQAGNLIWEQRFGDQMENVGNRIEKASDGGFFIIGESYKLPNENEKTYMIKLNSTGVKQTEWTMGDNSIADIQVGADGTPFVCGQMTEHNKNYAFLMNLRK